MSTQQLRAAREDARMAKRLGLREARRNFIRYALYWRAMRRLDRRP